MPDTSAIHRRRNAAASRLYLLRTLGLRHAIRRSRTHARHRRVLTDRQNRFTDQMWRDAAAEIGADVREIGPKLLEIRLGDALTRVRGQTTSLVDLVSQQLASDKRLSCAVLAEAGVPVPTDHVVDTTAAPPDDLLGAVGAPAIVKPAHGRGGRGITGAIYSASQLRRALTHAGRFDRYALVEHHVPGPCYRVLVLDGEVIDILERRQPYVTGDGTSSVEELIFAEFERRVGESGPRGHKPLVVDLDCLFALTRDGHRLRQIPAAGEQVVIKSATNYNDATQTTTLQPPYPESLVDVARRATAALGLRLGGVDVVTDDVEAPLSRAGGVVLEINPVPGLGHHYNVADPANAVHVAVPILQSLLKS